MSFFSLIIKNPFRNKTRSALAIVGIAIGIATIVALGIITDGLKASTEETLKAGGADFSIAESNVSDLFFSKIDEEYIARIKEVDGVNDVVGILMAIQRVEDNPYFVLIGIDPAKLSISNIKVTEGRAFAAGDAKEVIIGKVASEKLNKTVGDTITLNREEYKITGIFQTGDLQQDGGAFLSLENVQAIENKNDTVTMLYVKIDNDAQVEEVTAKIEEEYGNDLTTIASLEDLASIDQGLQTIDTASWAISLLAIVIGGIGVINTMIMSVYERTREIGVLKAVGWKDRRILSMILGESIVLTLVAGLVGAIMGIMGIQVLLALGMDSFIAPVYSADVFIRAFAVALSVGLLGGFYPAYRASRLPPTEALRYE
ncbi:MAG: ABC transporter permease [Euryarchaeota archaeon]|nr:ABC transporter permease [Euryarchaeota archaeon]MBU4607701.1 ABC transporter permease [Euryarchaeota archaeon]MBV1728899.1 ABC transporter permease [Methanobacterium sp.]MBV1754994.1 ABC transporter permease [Methanobacterium sp.]